MRGCGRRQRVWGGAAGGTHRTARRAAARCGAAPAAPARARRTAAAARRRAAARRGAHARRAAPRLRASTPPPTAAVRQPSCAAAAAAREAGRDRTGRAVRRRRFFSLAAGTGPLNRCTLGGRNVGCLRRGDRMWRRRRVHATTGDTAAACACAVRCASCRTVCRQQSLLSALRCVRRVKAFCRCLVHQASCQARVWSAARRSTQQQQAQQRACVARARARPEGGGRGRRHAKKEEK
jgi:hypothetical protein